MIPVFSVQVPAPVLESTGRPLFTPEKQLGYQVVWWLVITLNMKKHGKTRKNTEKHTILLVPVRQMIL